MFSRSVKISTTKSGNRLKTYHDSHTSWTEIECTKLNRIGGDFNYFKGNYAITSTWGDVTMYYLRGGKKRIQIKSAKEIELLETLTAKEAVELAKQLNNKPFKSVAVLSGRKYKGLNIFLLHIENEINLSVKAQAKLLFLKLSYRYCMLVSITLPPNRIKDRARCKVLASIRHLHCLKNFQRFHSVKSKFRIDLRMKKNVTSNFLLLLGYVHSSNDVLFIDRIFDFSDVVLKYLMREIYLKNIPTLRINLNQLNRNSNKAVIYFKKYYS